MGKTTRRIDDGDESEIDFCDVLIFTAIEDLEEKALELHLQRVGATRVQPTPAELLKNLQRWTLPVDGEQPPLKILTKCLNRAGNGYAGIELAHLLHTQHRPRLVAFCGIGGSLDVENAQLGNVIVSTSVHWRGFDKISGDSVSKEMRKILLGEHSVNQRLLNLVSAFIKENDAAEEAEAPAVGLFPTDQKFRVESENWLKAAAADEDLQGDIEHFYISQYFDRRKPIAKLGKVMSWDFVLNKKDIREGVKSEDKDLQMVEMETGGMSLAIRRAKEHFKDIDIELIAIRGVSDLCNKKTDDVFRELAADHAAAFLTGFLKRRYDSGF